MTLVNLPRLRGTLIVVSRYPFHLRPKNKQMFHYIRMIGDLVHDLELDLDASDTLRRDLSDEKIEGIRAYLGYSYLESGSVITTNIPNS